MNLNFGEMLRLKRVRAQLTLKQAAKQININFATLAKWERKASGKELPYNYLERLATLYSCSIDSLLETKEAS